MSVPFSLVQRLTKLTGSFVQYKNTNLVSQLPLRRNTESGIQSKEVVIYLPGVFNKPTINNTNNQYSKMTFLLISNLFNAHSTKKKITSRTLIKRKLPQSV